jgi:hypothetical protein
MLWAGMNPRESGTQRSVCPTGITLVQSDAMVVLQTPRGEMCGARHPALQNSAEFCRMAGGWERVWRCVKACAYRFSARGCVPWVPARLYAQRLPPARVLLTRRCGPCEKVRSRNDTNYEGPKGGYTCRDAETLCVPVFKRFSRKRGPFFHGGVQGPALLSSETTRVRP